MEDEIEDKRESLYVEKYPQMPRLGSRVKRGRDWMYDDHDNYGPGTVVGHLKEGIHKICKAESEIVTSFYRFIYEFFTRFLNITSKVIIISVYNCFKYSVIILNNH